MRAKSFELSDLQDYRLFYRLTKFSGFDIFDIYHQKVEGLELFDDYIILNVYGYLVVAIPDQFKHTGKYNLVATDGQKSEIINIHPFERVWEFYKLGHNNDNPGAFAFVNSLPAMDEAKNWRCDFGLYGPEIFTDPTGSVVTDIPDTLDGLLIYEPILSINGVAHLVYTVKKNRANRDEMLNDAYTPFASETLGGCVKLLTEWSEITNSPFENSEEIAVKARQFCSDLEITTELVQNIPNMQIYRYLNGEENARQAPVPVMFSDELSLHIKRKMSHSSFSSLLVLFPEMSIDLSTVLGIEKQLVDDDYASFVHKVTQRTDIDIYDTDTVLEIVDSNNHPGLSAFTRLKLGFLKTKKNLLLHIEENNAL